MRVSGPRRRPEEEANSELEISLGNGLRTECASHMLCSDYTLTSASMHTKARSLQKSNDTFFL